jgi:hypothetical protein
VSRTTLARVAVATTALAIVLTAACGGVSDGSKPLAAECSTERSFTPECRCRFGVDECPLDCLGEQGCKMTCERFRSSCSARCGDRCDYRCADGPTCAAECGADCIVSCQATSACTGSCGAFCNYTCDGAESCSPTVGDGSQVRCTSVGRCDVTCTGRCVVRCETSAGGCTVACPAGMEKKTCSEGFACGTDCG